MTRRARGDGTIYKQGDHWVAQLSAYDKNGKRIRPTVTGKTQIEVRKKRDELRRQIEAGVTARPSEQPTLAEYLERWLEAVGPSVRPRSLVMYRLHCRKHIAPEIGSLRLSAVTPDVVQVFLNRKLDTLSPKTVNHLRATLRTALNAAVDWGYLARNPVVKTKPAAAKPRQLRVLDQDEARRLLAAAEGDRMYALYAVALAMGLRLGEALGLQWQDVDFQTGRLHVRHGLQRVNGKLERTEPKTKLSNRSIKMPALVVASLKDHQQSQRAEAMVTPWVFATLRGTPIDPRNALRQFKALLVKAGLPETIRFHDLRHSFASLLLAKGVNIKIIADMLGHSNPTMLLTTYGHSMPQLRDAAADQMDEVLGL